MKTVEKIERKSLARPRRKRVAAYARVSVESARMQHSLSAQISYYSALIQKTPEWEYAGVYADYGISGTGMRDRDEFNRMLADCEAGRIDIILTKSIQRFARNTVDLLNTVRHLKELGIEVRFEKENINSMSGDGELMLSILASFAQEESRSISENSKWGIRKRFQSGEIGAANKHILGYRYDDELQQYVIIPEEAVIVRRMFQLYLQGKSLQAICDDLNGAGYRTNNGCLFQEASLSCLLKNEIYAGDLRRQKSYIADPIVKNKVKNKGELPQFYLQDAHEAILDRETYARVQAEIERRTALLNPTYPFTKKIICTCCGNRFTRKKSKVRGRTFYHWICRSKKENGVTCTSRNYSEAMLERISAGILGMDTFDAEAFETQVKTMLVMPDGSIEFHLVGNETRTWKDLHLNDFRHVATSTDAFLGKIHCACCGNTYHRSVGKQWVYWYCMGKKKKGCTCGNKNFPDYHLRLISSYVMGTESFDEDAFAQQVEEIRVLAEGRLEYRFADGRTVTWGKA